MKSVIRNLSALLVVTLVATRHAFAGAITPEIDPAMGAGAIALLAGAIMVIRGRARVK